MHLVILIGTAVYIKGKLIFRYIEQSSGESRGVGMGAQGAIAHIRKPLNQGGGGGRATFWHPEIERSLPKWCS